MNEQFCKDCGDDISEGGYQYPTGVMIEVPHPWRKTQTKQQPEQAVVCSDCFDLWREENFCEHTVSLDTDCAKCDAPQEPEGSSITFPIRKSHHAIQVSRDLYDDAGDLRKSLEAEMTRRLEKRMAEEMLRGKPVILSEPAHFTIKKSNVALDPEMADHTYKKSRDIGDVYYEGGKLWYWNGTKTLPVKIEGEA